MTAFPGKKTKRQLAEHGDFPSTEQIFRVMSRNIWNFSRYFKCVSIYSTISRRTHNDIPRNSGFRETLFGKH
jgi:hypothetical protein